MEGAKRQTPNVRAAPWVPQVVDEAVRIASDDRLLEKVMVEARRRGKLCADPYADTAPYPGQPYEAFEAQPGAKYGRGQLAGGFDGNGQVATSGRLAGGVSAAGKGHLELDDLKANRTSVTAKRALMDVDFDARANVDAQFATSLSAMLKAAMEAQGEGAKNGGKAKQTVEGPIAIKPQRATAKRGMEALASLAHAVATLGQSDRTKLGLDKSDDPFGVLLQIMASTTSNARVYHGGESAKVLSSDQVMDALCGLDEYFGYSNWSKDHAEAAPWVVPGSFAFASANLTVEEVMASDIALAVTGVPFSWAIVYGRCNHLAIMGHAGVPEGVPWAFVRKKGFRGTVEYPSVPVRDTTSVGVPESWDLVRCQRKLEMTLSAKRQLAVALVKAGMDYKAPTTIRGLSRSSKTANDVYRNNYTGVDDDADHDDLVRREE